MTGNKKIKLKVCGMRDAANIMAVAALRPDYMGFIFFDQSPRFVGNYFLLPNDFPEEVMKVGVFVNETTRNIRREAQILGLHYVQLHGNESVTQCEELKGDGIKVIKVFSVGDDFDFNVTRPYKKIVDFFLFDTKGKYHGGNGQAFNWNVLNNYDQEIPFVLSGGLSPDNISEISSLKGMNLHALDVNSGVEIAPALKNITKLEGIIKTLNKEL
jgi:phosphoribosylanthranilate isomerase